jgi:hypothetical protein
MQTPSLPVSDSPASVQFDFATGLFTPFVDVVERRVNDLREMFHDQAAVGELLAGDNPVVYRSATIPFSPRLQTWASA